MGEGYEAERSAELRAPVGLRIAVWCPQGRSELPLAAALCREQLPRELIAWSSDEAAPAEPEGVVADVWLVLCAGDPPPPPAWRTTTGGVWAVFPGTAARWAGATREATGCWRCDWVLTDLLPDECSGEDWSAWETFGRLAWLPAWFPGVTRKSLRREVLVVTDEAMGGAEGRSIAPVLAAAMGGPLLRITTASKSMWHEQVLLWAEDPVCVGAVLRLAAEVPFRVAVVGMRRRQRLRRVFLGGTEVWSAVAGPAPSRLADSVRPALLALGAESRVADAVAAPPWRWSDWLAGLAAPETDRTEASIAAGFLFSLGRYGVHGRELRMEKVLDGWFRECVAELWAHEWSPRRRREHKAAVWLLERGAQLHLNDAAGEHLLARLHAVAGDAVAATGAIMRYAALRSGHAGELPGSVAIWLWHRGETSKARSILESCAVENAQPAFASFVLAVACELTGLVIPVERHLTDLQAAAPGFLADSEATDARWILAAVVARREGAEMAATRFWNQAGRCVRGCEHFIELFAATESRPGSVCPQWLVLFAEALGQ